MVQQLELPRQLRGGFAAIPFALSGMLGAGVFVGLAPAASAAGGWLLLGLPIAAVTAVSAAFASADLSAAYRGPGASYACARSTMGLIPARIGSSAHLAGQVAAIAAVGGTVADHLLPSSPGAPAAVVLLAVLASTAGLRIRGVVSWLSLGLTVVVLAVIVAACFALTPAPPAASATSPGSGTVVIPGAAGVLFFAFLGFERLTAPADERDRYDRRAVRRGLLVAVGVVTACALLVGSALLYQLGPARLALSPTPALDALDAAAASNLRPLIGAGIAVAVLPILLGAVESFRSMASAVVDDGDLPSVLGRTGRGGRPYPLDVLAGVAAAGLAVLIEPAQAIALAACCLLMHYAFANACGRILVGEEQTWSGRSRCLGMGLSVVLAVSMPVPALLGTLAVIVAGPLLAGAVSGRWR